jgi:hypothetical protein
MIAFNASNQPMKPTEPTLTFVFEMRATLGPAIEVGKQANGMVRRIIP